MTSSERRPRVLREGPDPLLGQVVNGKFRIIEEVAAGGMGKIYRAEQLPLGRLVAVKVLHSRYTDGQEDPAFQKRFFLEASILSRLQHPNIVTVFDYGSIEGLAEEAYFMAMEFLPGETLHKRLKREGPLAAEATIGIVRQIAKGLREAHRQGVVHRDLKPSNVMLVPDESGEETIKILDFGLVKVLRDDSEELTKEGSFLGSPRYMSPEQIAHGRVDLRTDVYSLGVIFYQCLCGRTPFEADNAVHILMAHLHTPVPPFHERNPDVAVPEPLAALALRCLDKRPEGRPSTMDEVLTGLRQAEVALGLAQPGGGVMFTERSMPAGRLSAIPPPVESSALRPTLPQGEPAAPARRPLAIIVAVIALGTLGLAAGIFVESKMTPEAQTQAPAPAPRPAALGQYRLEIDSEPSGAAVVESGNVLGATPVGVLIDNVAVTSAPRRFMLRLPGHQPFELMVGPARDPSVRRVVTLVPVAAPPIAAPVVADPAPVPAPPRTPRSDTRPRRPPRSADPPSGDSDIRLHR
ncbi:MAG: serine/threonine-protein kinase [Deltaproteobacteria bacterium]|nr:serine/threonine-protein kinase [Myxococcales bacterium]MDP3213727.1 serine/threonine-protein kinase [Deltaproteobacteria bacterium]